MKAQYERPEIEIIFFEEEDVIRTSGGFLEVTPNDSVLSDDRNQTPIINI